MHSKKSIVRAVIMNQDFLTREKHVIVMLMRTDLCVPCDTLLTIAEAEAAECGEDLESMMWRFPSIAHHHLELITLRD
jgi:hypothetical protein